MHPRDTETPNVPQKLIKFIENFHQKLTPKRGGGGCSMRMQIMVVSERHQQSNDDFWPCYYRAKSSSPRRLKKNYYRTANIKNQIPKPAPRRGVSDTFSLIKLF